MLLSLIVLTACGGGSDVSGSGKQITMRPSVTPTEDIVRNSNLIISSNIDNESKRSAHILNTLGNDYYIDISHGNVSGARSSRPPVQPKDYCSSMRECNDVAFKNMKQWLIDDVSGFNSWVDNKDLRNALILAGFKNALNGTWNDIMQWVRDNIDKIKTQAQDIYSDIGEHQDFDITKSDLSATSHTIGGDAKIEFVFGKNKDIVGIIYNSIQAPGVSAALPADRIGTQDTKFKMNAKLYEYTLGDIGAAYNGGTPRKISFVSDKKLTLVETKSKLNKLIDYYKEQGGFFESFHNWPSEKGEYTGDKQTAINNALYAEVKEQINALTKLEPTIQDVNTDLDFQSVGKELGLAYSDFGIIRVDIDDEIFHGGYPDNKIELTAVKALNKDMNFKGRAVGLVERHDESGAKTDTINLSGDANLVFANNGKETLTANFTNWYDVKVERNADNSNRITFDNYTNEQDTYKFKHMNESGELVARNDGYSVDNFNENKTVQARDGDVEVTGHSNGFFVMDYFGPESTNNPTEFSGMLMYHENMPYQANETDGYDKSYDITTMIGFGGKKQY